MFTEVKELRVGRHCCLFGKVCCVFLYQKNRDEESKVILIIDLLISLFSEHECCFSAALSSTLTSHLNSCKDKELPQIILLILEELN